jgi:hypothetical protein
MVKINYSSRLKNNQPIKEQNCMVDLIQTNKFSNISDDKSIFFSKIDLIFDTIEEIKKTNTNCVLIVGNGDLPFTDDILNKIPNNVIKIFAQNNLCSSKKVESLPLGIGNSEPCKKGGHGEFWPDVNEKVVILNSLTKTEKSDEVLVYCNFRDYTNPNHRSKIKEISKTLDYIIVDESDLTYSEFIDNILRTTCNLCPAGNGLDTHRLWETLYCNRIPITFKVKNTRSYSWDKSKTGIYDDLYEKLPIIILDNEEQLKNITLIKNKIKKAILKWNNIHILDSNYWINKIKNTLVI